MFSFFFFNDTATTEIYTLSLHDALPISLKTQWPPPRWWPTSRKPTTSWRSEEHTSELQSHLNLVCRLLLEKKKTKKAMLNHDVSHGRTRETQRSSTLQGLTRQCTRHRQT